MSERWLPVLGYEGLYEVSDLGRVRSMPREVQNGRGVMVAGGRLLKPTVSERRGSLIVSLSVHNRAESRLVHRLVLESFVGPRPDGMEACHGDGDPGNNRLSNLRWDTHESNMDDQRRHGTNHNSRKRRCKHGHPLEAPNLKPAQAAKGGRSCLVCSREYAHARSQRRPFDPARADERLNALIAAS
ncbi:NUMOD4 motif-containing HNH endonuclease [Cellulomonas sp. ES6]|uniref:NUMOD4 motif-containing HNH endonuclease n=1 Tax=Cellulomonas sp. ES6 TaxID=3039384 RepID=UPI0024B75670|nr:NUMOD4 motif-containing HNH endonuclease [Cellulomonas sp. ES6]WHP18827.1 NUMOD4 motif-containing HNH endonuclease [Cellulomonas sp. ES6]